MKRQTAHRIVNLPGVYHNEETNCSTQSQSPRCLSQWRDKLHTAESISPVCITTKRETAHRRVNLPSVYHNEETNCAPRSQNQNLCLSLVAFKGTVRRNPITGENIYHERKDLKYKMLIYSDKLFDSVMLCCTLRRQLCDRISRKNTLACLSVAQTGSNHEIK